jgi:hypothetical protein
MFEQAEKMMEQRSVANNDKRRVPLNTKGKSLLSGNVFCGHCGSRLIITTNGRKHVRKDGGFSTYARIRYVCYNKSRHKQRCDGQTGYTVGKLDLVIDTVVHKLFATLSDLPKESILEERYAECISECQIALAQTNAALLAHRAEAAKYEAEASKVIRGEGKFGAELLNKMHEESKVKAEEAEQRIMVLTKSPEVCEQLREGLTEQFVSIKSWSDMYGTCDMETKKMILSRLFSYVRVSRDYAIEIGLAASSEELDLVLEDVGAEIG